MRGKDKELLVYPLLFLALFCILVLIQQESQMVEVDWVTTVEPVTTPQPTAAPERPVSTSAPRTSTLSSGEVCRRTAVGAAVVLRLLERGLL